MDPADPTPTAVGLIDSVLAGTGAPPTRRRRVGMLLSTRLAPPANAFRGGQVNVSSRAGGRSWKFRLKSFVPLLWQSWVIAGVILVTLSS